MKLTAQLNFESFPLGAGRDAHLVVSLTAPPAKTDARPPVCVIPVIDISGSMQGAKLHYAKQSVMKLIDHLAPGDFCGLVVFSSHVAVVSPPVELTQTKKDELKAAVVQLETVSNTNLAGGMLAALEQARDARLTDGMPIRVILFTDGQANAGPATVAADIVALLKEHRGRATLSAFGYGDDADQELLRDLSTEGRGNYAYVKSPEDALTAFARELGGLLSMTAQNVVVRLRANAPHRLTDVVSDVDAETDGDAVVLRIPELLADETRHLVLGFSVGAVNTSLPDAQPVGQVDVSLERFDGKQFLPLTLGETVQARFVRADRAAVKPLAGLDAIVATAQLVRAQIDAEAAARDGRHDVADRLMSRFADDAIARGHIQLAQAALRVAEGLKSVEGFHASRAYRASMRKGMSRTVSAMFDAEADADLRAAGRGQSTHAQSRMEASFGAKQASKTAPEPPKKATPARRGKLTRKRRGW